MTFYSSQKGFTLIETLVGSAVFLIVALSSYQVFGVLMDAVAISRAKIAVAGLANEEFEIIRNLPYEEVGIVGGLPSGKVQREKTVVRDGWSFDITATIRNVDDAFDGTIGGSPSDTSPADYKLADLDIECTNCKAFTPLKFTTLVAPHALETASTNGALFIQVFNSTGTPISGAEVTITNESTNPDTIIEEITDNEGWVRIIDAPPGTNAYSIIATKDGYTTERTYPIGGDAGATPVKPDATVVVQQVTQSSFAIDKLSTLRINTVNPSCASLPSIEFSLTGTKLIGDPDILKYPTENFSTDAQGQHEIADLEWDTYLLALEDTALNLIGPSIPFEFSLVPDETLEMNVALAEDTDMAFAVSVNDQNGVPIDGASASLTQAEVFSETKTTGVDGCDIPGQAIWSNLLPGDYTLTVSKNGYQTDISNVSFSSFQTKQIILLP